jgi:PadR family transcriptional regulator, regulatory protein PadR
MRLKPEVVQKEEEKITKSFLDLEVLYLLRQEPKTLYSIQKALQQVFGTRRSFGTIYPHLERLEEEGLIEGRTLKSSTFLPKRIYRLTGSGRSTLNREIGYLSKMVAKLKDSLA